MSLSQNSEVPFTTIGVIKAKIMNKDNYNNEIILKYLLHTITSPLLLFSSIILSKKFLLLFQLNCSFIQITQLNDFSGKLLYFNKERKLLIY